MAADRDPDPAALADAALGLVGTDPRRARRLAAEAAAAAARAGAPGPESRAPRAAGLAALTVGQLDDALAELRTAVRRGARSGSPVVAAEARMSLAYVLLERGAATAALAEADRAAAGLRGPVAGRILGQRALLLQRAGRTREALATYRRALPRLLDGDPRDEARVRNNRGLLLLYLGRLDAAEEDLTRAARLYAETGMAVYAADAQLNLGMVAARRGDVPVALGRYDDAEAAYRRLGLPGTELLLGRGELLL